MFTSTNIVSVLLSTSNSMSHSGEPHRTMANCGWKSAEWTEWGGSRCNLPQIFRFISSCWSGCCTFILVDFLSFVFYLQLSFYEGKIGSVTWSPLSYFIPFTPLTFILALITVFIPSILQIRKRKSSSIAAASRHTHCRRSGGENVSRWKIDIWLCIAFPARMTTCWALLRPVRSCGISVLLEC